MIINQIEESFLKYNSKTAVIDEIGEYSYQELEADANKLATYLINKGYGCDNRFGIYLERSYLGIVAMIGVMKTGAAYLPISKNNPQARINNIVKDCGLTAVITENELEDTIFYVQNVCIKKVIQAQIYEKKIPDIKKEDISYILYTSGSTGNPKGVCITCEAFSFFVNWSIHEFHITDRDRIASISSFSFDLSVFEIYGSLITGATICIASNRVKRWPNSFCAFLEKYKISILYAVPSFLNGLAHYGAPNTYDLSSLRLILFAGEVFWIKNFDYFYHQFPRGIQYANLYGPTETNVCTYYRVPESYKNDCEFPIGKILPHLSYCIKKAKTEDEFGELVIFGPCVMKGYWGELLEHKGKHWYVKDGMTGYCTGDIVALREDGNIMLLGRKDSIIKVNGYRVSLNEIERTILEHPLVEQVYVGITTKANMQEIVAFVKFLDSGKRGDIEVIKSLCKHNLISYMVPAKIIECVRFPLTDTNKINGKGLLKEYQQDERGE